MSLDNAIKEARKAINRDLIAARLGDNGQGNPYDLDTPGNYWVQKVEANGNLSQPVSMPLYSNANVPPKSGIAVYIGYDEFGTQCIWRASRSGLLSADISPLILNPLDTAVYGKVNGANIANFFCQRHGDLTNFPLTVVVFPGAIERDDTMQIFSGATVDLAALVPGDDLHCYAVVFIKTDLTLEAFASTPVALTEPLTDVDMSEAIAQRTADSLTIWAWELSDSQTILSPDPTKNVDLRQWLNIPGTGGSGTVTSVAESTDVSYLEISGSPITTSGTIAINKKDGLTANQFVATPDGSTGKADLRAIAAGDLTSALVSPPPIGTTTPNTGYFSALRLKIGGFFGIFTHANSADRTYTLPNASGTVALTSDIPAAGITQLTGDGTAGPGSGSQAFTLANSGVSAGSYTNASVTFDAKGRATAASSGATPAPNDAHYVTTQAESGLSNEFNLGGLTTGLLKHTVSGSVSTPATAVAGTDYTTPTGTENLSNKTLIGDIVSDKIIFNEWSESGTPSSDTIWQYAADDNGFTFPRMIESNGTIFQLPRDIIVVCKNTTGSSVGAGSAVMFSDSDATSTAPCIALADNDLIYPADGIAMDTAANNAFMRVMVQGIMTISGLAGHFAGDWFYLHSTAGQNTKTKPTTAGALTQRLFIALNTSTAVFVCPKIVQPFLKPGSNGTIAVADDTNPAGVKWVNPGLSLITSFTVAGGNIASIDISSIPATYSHLMLVAQLRSDVSANTDNVYLRLNADSTAGNYYSYTYLINTATPVFASVLQRLGATATGFELSSAATAATATSGYRSALVLYIHDYASSSRFRTIEYNGYKQVGDSAGNLHKLQGGGLWKNTSAAVNQITLLPVSGSNFVAGTTYALYGLAA